MAVLLNEQLEVIGKKRVKAEQVEKAEEILVENMNEVLYEESKVTPGFEV
jgi:hypothetical protein